MLTVSRVLTKVAEASASNYSNPLAILQVAAFYGVVGWGITQYNEPSLKQ